MRYLTTGGSKLSGCQTNVFLFTGYDGGGSMWNGNRPTNRHRNQPRSESYIGSYSSK